MLRCNIAFRATLRRSGCYVVTSISSNSTTLWMLRCNIHFNQLPRRSGCYVVTIHFNQLPRRSWMLCCNIHFQSTSKTLLDAYVVTSISYHTFQTLWMLRGNIHLKSLPRRSGCYVVTSISINLPDANVPKSPLTNVRKSPLNVPCPQVKP